MWTRELVKRNARDVFQNNYWPTVLTFFVYGLIVGGAGAILSMTGVGSVAVAILLGGPMEASISWFMLKNRRGEGQLEDLFFCFQNNYGNILMVSFMQKLYIFLWSLLFIVPGIIKSYEYRLVPFILAENPGIEYRDALEQSRAMMDGEKMNVFVLDLSFLGWWFLSLLTGCVLIIFWTQPYYMSTRAELYEALKAKYREAV